MGNCSNINNSQTVTLSSGTLTSGFCHNSLQTTYEEFISQTTGSLTGNMAAFTAGDDTPAAGDQNKLWLKQNASTCVPEGWHWYNGSNTAWEDVPVPETALPSSLTPVGAIIMYGGGTAPTNWLLCNGGTFDTSTYPALDTVLGSTYGAAGQLPDLRSRVPVGMGDGGTGLTNRSLNDTGGEESVTLTTAQIPEHNHEIRSSTWETGGGSGGMGNSTDQQSWGYTEDTGGGGSHENMPPFIVVNFIIKAK